MGKYVATLGPTRPPYTQEAIRNVSTFFRQHAEMRKSLKNWCWEYRVCFSCDDSWKLADENLTEDEAKERSTSFVKEAFNYGVAIDVRCSKMHLCDRCSKIGVVA